MSAEEDFERWAEALPSEHYSSERSKNGPKAAKQRYNFDDKSTCDLTIMCQGHEIKCHRSVLTANSSVFERMLVSGFKEGSPGSVVEIHETEYKTLEKVIQFLYTADIVICGHEVMTLLTFADMYDITEICVVCEKMLHKHVTVSVAMVILEYANRYSLKLLTSQVIIYCVTKFYDGRIQQIPQTCAFLEACCETVTLVVSHPALNIPSENEAFDALFDWALYSPDTRSDMLPSMLQQCIRVHNIDEKFIRDKISAIGEENLDPKMLEVLLTFVANLQTGNIGNKLLLPRNATRQIDAIRVCHYDYHMAFSDFYMNKNQNEITETGVSCIQRHSSGGCVYQIRSLYTGRNDVYGISALGELLLLDLREYHWIKIDIPDHFRPDHLIFLPTGKVINLSDTQIAQIENTGTWKTEHIWYNSYFYTQNIKLSTYYKNKLLIFAPEQNAVYVFDTIRFDIDGKIELQLFNDVSCFELLSRGGTACLLGNKYIYVLHMETILKKFSKLYDETAGPKSENTHGKDTQHPGTADEYLNVKYVKSPAEDKQFSSAAILGDNLYLLESTNTRWCMKFYCTNFNKLIELSEGETAEWENIAKGTDRRIVKHVYDCEYSSDRVMCKFINSRILNPTLSK